MTGTVSVRMLFFSAVLAASSFAQTARQNVDAQAAGAAALSPATQQLLNAYPGVRVHMDGSRIAALYGAPMTPGDTVEAAAAAFLNDHAGALGVSHPELTLVHTGWLNAGKFRVFEYRQSLDGLPVEYGHAIVLVLSGEPNKVVYAGGKLAQMPAGGFAAIALSADQAIAAAQTRPEAQGLTSWPQPELIAYFGEDNFGTGPGQFGPAVRAWKVQGERPILEDYAAFTFFVDAASGQVLAVRDDKLHVNVNGSIHGNGSPGTQPDMASNPPVPLAMRDMRASITGGNNAFSDADGNFTITNAGAGAVTVTTGVTTGRWVDVDNQQGGEITASDSVTPPGPADLLLNPAPSQFDTAQVNVALHTNNIHNYFTDRSDYTGLDSVRPANVNINQSCNAFFTTQGTSINFYIAANGCNNTGYSSVVAHEYGHFVVFSRGLGQGGFGEGFGDTCSMLLYNDQIIGRNFRTNGSSIRNPLSANIQYPCVAEAHTCGQLIGAVWWRIRTNLISEYGEVAGLEMARQLHVDWMQITSGGTGPDNGNSAHPGTAIEILMLDDDNGDLADGTPNYDLICAAFSQHNIDCPALLPVRFVFPDGIPAQLVPDQPTAIRVNVEDVVGTATPGTGTVSYRVGNGAFTTIPMAQGAPNEYTATLPAFACGDEVDFYFTAGSSDGNVSSPSDAPATTYLALVRLGTIVSFEDDAETNQGWTLGVPGDTATTGVWSRTDPEGTGAQPEDDHTPAPGTMCFVTDGRGGSLGDFDIDNGSTTLLSPVLDLSAQPDARIEYWRWYSNTTGAAPNQDTFVVQITNNGSTWVTAETVGPDGPEADGGWFFHDFAVSDFVTPNATVRVRFIASDLGDGSLVEAAVDDFRVTAPDCESAAPCPGDVNGDNIVDLSDLAVLLSNFGVTGDATREQGDLDGDLDVDLADLATLLSNFGASCP